MTVAELPNPEHPSFVILITALGAFFGATVGRVRHKDRDEIRAIAENWAYVATALGLVVYALAQA